MRELGLDDEPVDHRSLLKPPKSSPPSSETSSPKHQRHHVNDSISRDDGSSLDYDKAIQRKLRQYEVDRHPEGDDTKNKRAVPTSRHAHFNDSISRNDGSSLDVKRIQQKDRPSVGRHRPVVDDIDMNPIQRKDRPTFGHRRPDTDDIGMKPPKRKDLPPVGHHRPEANDNDEKPRWKVRLSPVDVGHHRPDVDDINKKKTVFPTSDSFATRAYDPKDPKTRAMERSAAAAPVGSTKLPEALHSSCQSPAATIALPPTAESSERHEESMTELDLIEPVPSNVAIGCPMIEVLPGMELPLRGSEETQRAIKQGFVATVTCMECMKSIQCIKTAEYVLCPLCQAISPLECSAATFIYSFGVGLGFLPKEDVK
jgi:hypothetical protein